MRSQILLVGVIRHVFHSHTMHMRRFLFSLLFITGVLLTSIARAQDDDENRLLLPIGSDHTATLAGFIKTALTNSHNQTVNILVLPIGHASNPDFITSVERSADLNDAEMQRSLIEMTCVQAVPENMTCNVILAPILSRSDASNPTTQEYFSDELSGILILDGSNKIARQVIGGTLVEQALDEAYQNGVVIAASGDGGNLFSLVMIGGYNQGYEAKNALSFGAIDIWNDAYRHGLLFGLQNAIIDQQFFIDNRFGRLINAITLLNVPHVGIGIDSPSGITVLEEMHVKNVYGSNPVAILDAETYHAAQSIRYHGPENTLSLRNILVHLLAPGEHSFYDLDTRQSSAGPPPQHLERTFDSLTLPEGAGTLLIAGDLSESLPGNPVINRFLDLATDHAGDILVVANGFSSDSAAQNLAEQYAQVLDVPSQIVVIPEDSSSSYTLPEEFSGILLIGNDQSKIQPNMLLPIKEAWLAGKPLLADNAGAAAAGKILSTHEPYPSSLEDIEKAIHQSFTSDRTNFIPGLGLLNLSIEPQTISNNRWGNMFSLAYNYPDLLSLGLTKDTAVEINADGATALGRNVVFVLDLRDAFLDLGDKAMLDIGNGLLDVFAPQEDIYPVAADIATVPRHAPTPVLPSPTLAGYILVTPLPTPTPSAIPDPTKTPEPTKRRKPTATPLEIPPPSDPGTSNLMVGFGVFIVVIILIGIGMNWRRLFTKDGTN